VCAEGIESVLERKFNNMQPSLPLGVCFRFAGWPLVVKDDIQK
jgi:hypothetical protein